MYHMFQAIDKSQSLIEAMFKVRETPCSYNKTLYEEEKEFFKCNSSINIYHCIIDNKKRQGEICIKPIWVQPNSCPKYNIKNNTLNAVPCNASSGCPDISFLSNEVYKYPVCSNTTFAGDKKVSEENLSTLPVLVAGMTIVFFLIVSCVVYSVCRKKKIG